MCVVLGGDWKPTKPNRLEIYARWLPFDALKWLMIARLYACQRLPSFEETIGFIG